MFRRRTAIGLLIAASTTTPTPLLDQVGCTAPTCAAAGIEINGHWLRFRGRNALLIGDSITQGWMELGVNFNQTAYVDALAARGINVLMLWSYIGIDNQVADVRIGYDAPEIWPWSRTGGTFNLAQFNPAWFSRLESLIAYADSKNIAVLLTIHDGWTKTRFGGHPFNQANGGPLSTNSQYVELHDYNNEMPATFNPAWTRQQKNQYYQERFVDRIIQSTNPFTNVMLEVCNEGEWYNQTNFRAYSKHFIDFIKARTTTNPTMVNDDHIGGTNFRGETNCDIISLHKPLWSGTTAVAESFNFYDAEFKATPVKPQYFSEPVPEYQGDDTLHDGLMRLMWGTVLAGAGFVVQNDASWGFDPNTLMAAQAADRDVVLDREGYCATFFAGVIDLGNMTPNSTLSSTGVCLAHSGTEYVVYSQGGTSLTVNLAAAAGKTLNCRFYNPRTGAFEPAFTRTGGSAAESFTKPGSSDWVLHIVEQSGAPVARITTVPAPARGFAPLTVNFDGSGSSDPDGTIVGYAWDYTDDGLYDQTGASPHASHPYATVGAYTCRLRVTDNEGRTGTTTATVAVLSIPGDFDGDGDVDQDDFGHFQSCYSGSGVPFASGCQSSNLDNDEDVDTDDFTAFHACMNGANAGPSLGCGS